MPYSAKSDDTNTISQFVRRKAITITTGGTSTPINYQVKLIITYESGMQADFDDIRFNTKAGIYINYWIETHTESTTATVWIELSDAITDPGSDTIWMYYGNQGLSNSGNGDDVFLFFDDFPGSSIDTNKWTVVDGDVTVGGDTLTLSGTEGTRGTIEGKTSLPIGIALYSRARYVQMDTVSTHFCTLRKVGDWNTKIDTYCRFPAGDIALSSFVAGDYTVTTWESVSTQTDWHNYHITWKSGEIKSYQNDTLRATHTTHVPSVDLVVALQEGTVAGGDIDIDWLFAVKFITNEPIVSYGSIQHQRRIPQFIG